MRLTFDLYVEYALDRVDPGFFNELCQRKDGEGIDRGAWLEQLRLATVVVDQDLPEGHLRYVAHLRAECKAAEWFAARGIEDWRSYGRAYVEQVENKPITAPQGVLESPNPAVICKCGSPMIKRNAGRGLFWGCSRFPDCTATRRISK